MVVNFLFPFNDALLQNYQKPEFGAGHKKKLCGVQIIMTLVPFLIIFIGEESPSQKAIYFVPAIFLNLCATILLFSKSEKKIYLSLTITSLNISQIFMSANVMSVCFIYSQLRETLADSVRVMLISELVFLILLVIGYRLNFSYQLKHGWSNKKSNWNSGALAVAIVLIGKRFLSRFSWELVVFLLCLLGTAIQLMISIGVLEYRKYTRFLSINENDAQHT